MSGKLIEAFPTQQVSEKFKKREFVIEKTESNSSQNFTDTIKFQLTQDRCNLLDNIRLNDNIRVHFNIKGSKWQKDGKTNYFTNLDAWRIESLGSEKGSDAVLSQAGSDFGSFSAGDDNDDLPF